MSRSIINDGRANFLVGCEAVSPGCRHCISAHYSFLRSSPNHPRHDDVHDGLTRFKRIGRRRKRLEWTGRVKYLPDRVRCFLRAPERSYGIVGVCNTSDLFIEGVPFCVIDQILAAFMLRPRSSFYAVTKRSERLRRYASYAASRPASYWYDLMLRWQPNTDLPVPAFPLENLWLGVSCENQEWFDKRSPALDDVRQISSVPMLELAPLQGPIDMSGFFGLRNSAEWVTVGGEFVSGGTATNRKTAKKWKCGQCYEWWIADIIRQCAISEVPVFVRHVGNRFFAGERGHETFFPVTKIGGEMSEWPEPIRVRQLPCQGLMLSEPKEQQRRQIEAAQKRPHLRVAIERKTKYISPKALKRKRKHKDT